MVYNPQAITDAIRVIVDELNGGNPKEVAALINETLQRTHRTLQQEFWSTVLLAQIQYADATHDPRNEQAVQLAQAVKETATKLNFDYGLAFI